MKRIEFIDAMRGFAMLLVVIWHIYGFSYNMGFGYGVTEGSPVTFSWFFGIFHMPLFFFISGFILYGAVQKWQGWRDCGRFLSRKARQLLLPTLVIGASFVVLFGVDARGALCQDAKAGYWFTLMLLVYFCLFGVHHALFRQSLRLKAWQSNLLLVSFALFCFYFVQMGSCRRLLGIDAYNLFSIAHLRHYLFFVLGYFARQHYSMLERLLDGRKSSAVVIASFFLTALPFYAYGGNLLGGSKSLIYFTLSLLTIFFGILTIFSFFRRYEPSLSASTRLGRALQFIGRRTLDIYLLHYFFLPRHLSMVGDFFRANANPTLEFALSVAISLIVVAFSLIVSATLRLSPFLAHHLFGEKYKIQQ